MLALSVAVYCAACLTFTANRISALLRELRLYRYQHIDAWRQQRISVMEPLEFGGAACPSNYGDYAKRAGIPYV